MRKRLTILHGLCLLLISFTCLAFDNQTRVAFFYGDNPPLGELHAFNVVVVDPQSGLSPKKYNNAASQLYAYVAIGEVSPEVNYFKEIDKRWIGGRNHVWNSYVMDMSNPAWRMFLLNKVITPLWEQGYRGFFLDTLDSYQLMHLSLSAKEKQIAGMIDLIKQIKRKFPEASIITNRGFELLKEAHEQIDALAAESLFSGWNNTLKTYKSVDETERKQLLFELNKAHENYHLPIIIIDYVSPDKRDEARTVAKKIANLGFIPWVSNPSLDSLGIGTIEVIPRRILILYDRTPDANNDLNTISSYNVLGFIFQYMGYVPELFYVYDKLPEEPLNTTYAGIISWFNKPLIKQHKILEAWLLKQMQSGIPIVFMQNFGISFKSAAMKSMRVKLLKKINPIQEVKVTYKDSSVGYEAFPNLLPIEFQPVRAEEAKILLKLTASTHQEEDAIAITSWGGYVLEPYDLLNLPSGDSQWIINPFLYFKEALRLPTLPIPDITSENGKRIFIAQIDGDAFISRVVSRENSYAGEVILDEILKIYKLPTTVSFVQKEFELLKENPELQKRMINVAKEIYKLPWVSAATHTYSHPLHWWGLVENQQNTKLLSYPDTNYLFSYKKELAGSADFINTHLLPKGKKVVAVLWSGDANVNAEALKAADEAGLKNINGMSKVNLSVNNSLTNWTPFGIDIGKFYHVFSPISNEFRYTNSWARPLYGFQKVIHTFELGETPHRYTPILIYYHFYSATDQGALEALKKVYEWTLKQSIIPLDLVDYINKAHDFNQTAIAKFNNGSWLIANNGAIREFRWLEKSYPDLLKSRNIVGYNFINQEMYIHLGPHADTHVVFKTFLASIPYLVEANAKLFYWDRVAENKIKFYLQGYVDLSFQLANMKNCKLYHDNKVLSSQQDSLYYLKGVNHGTFEIQCENAS